MILHFFGLTQEYKISLHKSIFSLITYGKGGWTWESVYFQMPIFLRQFYLKELSIALEEESKATSGATTSPSVITPPPFVRDSTKKAT